MFKDCHRWLRLLAVGALLGLLAGADLLFLSGRAPAPSVDEERPRLVVLVVFDQLRGDYLQRWHELFASDGGLRRLMEEGAWFTDCHYPYANTVTAPGHASLLTGCSPDRHGIVANDWYDRYSAIPVYCMDADGYEQVPTLNEEPRTDGRQPRRRGVAPKLLMAPTVGDVLKTATDGKCKIVGLSMKERAAILPTGHQADACYWLDSDTGLFVTSSYYASRLHPWAAELNQQRPRPVDRWFGKDWLRLRPDVDYVRYSGPDDVAGEGKGIEQGRTFPHPMTGGLKQPGKLYYKALYNSPFGNDYLLELVKRAIDGEQLGNHDQPDMLCVSFSSNDAIGHTWGPDSQEVLDVTLRTDEIMRDLLAHLDLRVGRGRYLLVLTADHGICPLPEVSLAQGKSAGRISFSLLGKLANAYLTEHFHLRAGTVRWFEDAAHPPWFYLNQRVIRDYKLDSAAVARTLADWMRHQPGIQQAYTRAELEGQRPAGADERVWKSYYPSRCGDVTVVLSPYHLFLEPLSTGTTHGSPHPYDTHVPLLVYGSGVVPGVRADAVTPQATAAIMAHALRLQPPQGAEAPLPAGLFRE